MNRRLTLVTILIGSATPAWSQCQVVNSASYQRGLPSGGALATAFCQGVVGEPGLHVAPPSSPPPFTLAGVQISVNKSLAPILAVYIPSAGSSAPTQINFQVPMARNAMVQLGISDKGELNIFQNNSIGQTTYNWELSPLDGELPPGLGGFFSDADGFAIARHTSDNTPVTPASPAHPGETITVYANDFYQVWPPPPIGFPAPKDIVFQYDPGLPNYYFQYFNLFLQAYPTLTQCAPVASGQCSIARTPALQILFRGLAANQIGVEEIRFVVPANQAPGDWALFFNSGSCTDGSGLCGTGAFSSAYVKLPVR